MIPRVGLNTSHDQPGPSLLLHPTDQEKKQYYAYIGLLIRLHALESINFLRC